MTAKQDRFRAFLAAKRGDATPTSKSPANVWLRREIDRAHGRTAPDDAEREELKAELEAQREELAAVRAELADAQ